MTGQPQRESSLSNVLDLIRVRTGLAPSSNRVRDFEAAIRKTMFRVGIAAFEDFAQALDADERTFDALVAELTVGETYFFREPGHFDVLRRDALPELMLNRDDRLLRVWSAGCASGEEAYSLAILLEQESLAERASILGTDLCRRALHGARLASYGTWSLRNSSPDFLARYFHRRGERFALADRIRKRVDFAYLNLAADDYPSPATGTADVDLIFCRNVLIYFQPDLVARVARRLYAALAVGGWLVTGPSDPPLWDHAPYDTVVTSGGILYRRVAPALAAPRGRKPAVQPIASDGLRAERVAPQLPLSLPLPPPLVAPAAPPDPMEAAHKAFAAGDFRRALALTQTLPVDVDVCGLRVRALANLGRSDGAETAAAAAVAAHPLQPELRYLHAVVLIGLERHEEAEAALRRVIYLDRSLAVAHFTLASLLMRRGAVEEARRCYRAVLGLCAERPQDEIALLSDGEHAGRLAEAARGQLALTATRMEIAP